MSTGKFPFWKPSWTKAAQSSFAAAFVCRTSLLQDGVEIIHQGLVVDIAVIPLDHIPFLVHQK